MKSSQEGFKNRFQQAEERFKEPEDNWNYPVSGKLQKIKIKKEEK